MRTMIAHSTVNEAASRSMLLPIFCGAADTRRLRGCVYQGIGLISVANSNGSIILKTQGKEYAMCR